MATQREHIDSVARITGHPVDLVAEVLNASLRQLSDSLIAGEPVTFTGVGTFSRTAKGVAFKPGATLRRGLAQNKEAAPSDTSPSSPGEA